MCNIFILSRYIDLFVIYLYIINICDEFSLSRLNNRNYYNQLLRRKEGKEEKTSRKETVTKEKNIHEEDTTEDKEGNFSTPFLNTTHSLTPKEITITQ